MAVREFVEKEVKPVASRLDVDSRFPMDSFVKMGKLWIAGVFVPQQYGVAGLGMTERAIILEELGRHAAGLAMALMTHHLGVDAILSRDEEQKNKLRISRRKEDHGPCGDGTHRWVRRRGAAGHSGSPNSTG
jgi:alkylation response protein AidB-like acyl-CoA dehydrogenase